MSLSDTPKVTWRDKTGGEGTTTLESVRKRHGLMFSARLKRDGEAVQRDGTVYTLDREG